MPLSHRPRLLVVFLLLLPLVLAACSGSAPPEPVVAPAPAPEPEPEGPAFALVYFDDGGLRHHDTRTAAPRMLAPGAVPLDAHAVSPDGTVLAAAYTDGEASTLALIDLADGTVQAVHTAEEELVFTLAWALDGTALAFGFYRPRPDGAMGTGGIRVAGRDGRVADVGCSASRTVAQWLPDGNLVVGDGRNLYVVARDGCQTLATTDVRKKHHIAFSPDGRRMAYLFRDLVYNSRTRQYVPDSTLYLADADGTNQKKIYGNDRRVRHLAWSPDGTELAFDVQSQDDPARRHVLLYKPATGQAGFLLPPDAGGSQTHAVWAPGGANIAFDWAVDGTVHKAVRAFMNTAILADHAGPTWGWAGDEAVVVPTPEGGLQVLHTSGDVLLTLPPGRTLLHIQAVPAS